MTWDAIRIVPSRRAILFGTAAEVAVVAGGVVLWRRNAPRVAGSFEIELTEVQWRERLTEAESAVLRGGATEETFCSLLNDETQAGRYVCADCGDGVYASGHKYDSGTGWPSFTQALRRPSGPCLRGRVAPTGLRPSSNATSSDFTPAAV